MSYDMSESGGAGVHRIPHQPGLTTAERWRALMFDRRFERVRLTPAPGLTRIGPAPNGWVLPGALITSTWSATIVGTGLARELATHLRDAGIRTVDVLTGLGACPVVGDPRATRRPASTDLTPGADRACGSACGNPHGQLASSELLLMACAPSDAEPAFVREVAGRARPIVVGVELPDTASARSLARLVRDASTVGFEVIARHAPRRVTFLREGALER